MTNNVSMRHVKACIIRTSPWLRFRTRTLLLLRVYTRMCQVALLICFRSYTIPMHFLVWQLVYFDANFTEICFLWSNGQKTSISSDNSLVLNRRHPINGINDELVSWRMYCHLASINGPLTRYVKLRVAHAPGMPGTFSPPPLVSDPDLHHGTCVTRVPWLMPGSLTSGFLLSWWRGKRSRHSRCMRSGQFYVSVKRSMKQHNAVIDVRIRIHQHKETNRVRTSLEAI